jgi:hypothetical protein
MDQEQQELHQQPGWLNRAVLAGSARFDNLRHRDESHKLVVYHLNGFPPIDRRSLQHLFDFLDSQLDSHDVAVAMTELDLYHVGLVYPADGGLDVLRSFFSRSDSNLAEVTLYFCDLW